MWIWLFSFSSLFMGGISCTVYLQWFFTSTSDRLPPSLPRARFFTHAQQQQRDCQQQQQSLIRFWPWRSSSKQVIFLNELEEVLELLVGPDQITEVEEQLFNLLARCISSEHFQVGLCPLAPKARPVFRGCVCGREHPLFLVLLATVVTVVTVVV